MPVKGSWERAWISGRALPAAAAVLRSVVSKSKYVRWRLQFGKQEHGLFRWVVVEFHVACHENAMFPFIAKRRQE